MSQMGTELIQNADKDILITLMYSRASQQILYVEAEKDFVDLVVGFLTLPIGFAIKLLSESERSSMDPIATAIRTESNLDALVTPKTVGGIANVFKSLQRLEAEETLCADKKMLADPKPVYGLGGSLAAEAEMGLWREGDLEPICVNPQAYFTCGASSHCSFVSPRYGTKCPRHQKKMTTQCKMMDCANEVTLNIMKHDGYAKSNSKYFVTDNLEIFPSSKSLALLQKLNVENMSSLDSIFLRVGTEEVLQLLRASLTSGKVLTEVFGKSLRDTPRTPHQEILSQYNHSNSINLLQKWDQDSEDSSLKESMEIACDWGRGLYSALKEVQDTAFHSSLVHYVKEREHRIGSALRDLGSASSETASRTSSCGTGTRNNKKIRANGDLMPKPCKEMLMLEKQVDKVMARLCHLISSGPSLDSPSIATKSKPCPVKPPWTMYQPSSRIRPPSAPLHP